MTKDCNSECRPVHAARELLEMYVSSGRRLELIKSTKITGDYGVWQCVFENEPEAYRELLIKELQEYLSSFLSDNWCSEKTRAMCLVNRLTQSVEFNSPLTLNDCIKLMIDTLGKGIVPSLKIAAEEAVIRRQKIVSQYTNKDTDWVGHSATVLNGINNHV